MRGFEEPCTRVLVRGTGISPNLPYCCFYTTGQGGLMLWYFPGQPVIVQEYDNIYGNELHVIAWLVEGSLDRNTGVQGEPLGEPSIRPLRNPNWIM